MNLGLRTDVAALYVDPRGPYPKLVADWFDAQRNADTYAGNLPIVAHPPCAPWSRLSHFNLYHKAEHALLAVGFVQRVGGVLEHPAHSKLWKQCGLPYPNALPDQHGGWTLEIDQCRWGHVGRKTTWLYIVGCSRESLPPIPGPGKPTHWCGGGRRARGPGAGRQVIVPAGIKVASAQQRRRTPPLFAEWLINVAAQCARRIGDV